MGRDPWSNRFTVEQCRILCVNVLKSAGVFNLEIGHPMLFSRWDTLERHIPGMDYWLNRDATGGLSLEIGYSPTDPTGWFGSRTHLTIVITTTPCHFGGERYWFHCPIFSYGRVCHRRVGKLYLPPRAEHFGCRRCHNLTYRKQKEHDKTLDNVLKHPEIYHQRIMSGDIKAAFVALRLMWRIERD